MNDFERYVMNYDSYKKSIIFEYYIPGKNSGLGDFVLLFNNAINYCIENNVKLLYLVNNSVIQKYIKLKYSFMYLDKKDIADNTHYITKKDEVFELFEDIPVYIGIGLFFRIKSKKKYNFKMRDVFYFDDVVINNGLEKFPLCEQYISIHLRLGDKYISNKKKWLLTSSDTRRFEENDLFKFIENNLEKTIAFFCDNSDYRNFIASKYNNIIVSNCVVSHVSPTSTSDEEILDAVTELYLLSRSEKIYKASFSNFSYAASIFNNIPLEKI